MNLSSKFENQLFPHKFAYYPPFVVYRFIHCIEKYGEDLVFNSNQFKKTRELTIGAFQAHLINEFEKFKYYVRPEHYLDIPDLYFERLVDKVHEKQHVEITEWKSFSSETLPA